MTSSRHPFKDAPSLRYDEVEPIIREFALLYDQLPFGNEYQWAALQGLVNLVRDDASKAIQAILPNPIPHKPPVGPERFRTD